MKELSGGTTRGGSSCTSWGASSPRAEVVSFFNRSPPRLRRAFLRASARSFGEDILLANGKLLSETTNLTVSYPAVSFSLLVEKSTTMSRQDKATTERHARILRELVKQPDNKVCADCKRNDPRWASWNMSVDRDSLINLPIITSLCQWGLSMHQML